MLLIISLIVNLTLVYIIVTISKKMYVIRYTLKSIPPFAKIEGTLDEAKAISFLKDEIKILEAENAALKKDTEKLSIQMLTVLLLSMIGKSLNKK